jgi:hypothetical protein
MAAQGAHKERPYKAYRARVVKPRMKGKGTGYNSLISAFQFLLPAAYLFPGEAS